MPKPQPPKGSKRCNCRTCCMMRDRTWLVRAYRTVIANGVTLEEFRAVNRISHAAMLPRDLS
jgi:hypothetical protein